ncbi:two-component hybrid sensor and regulator [Marinobacter santoriniensis NKSG1]|uniref:histidine kinase n=1 Tax=Marinobacter santoriniensis NKSG1 TaxID=1288826 RepID=M7CTF9_9GAMM|nr:hybrid sensor histidine kinase/response regulator [Marinobacter santoriniensis]EMP56404.1 two-component hybrid sensor and regulator [Marinobacter santoriniensis NKSG1]
MNASEIEQRTAQAALEPYIESMGRTALLTTVVPITFAGILWPEVGRTSLLVWLLLVLTVIGIRYLASTAYEKKQSDFRESGRWCRRMLMISLSLGLLWAFAILNFFAESSPPHQVFTITIAVTLGIGSISAGTHWLPLYYVYGLPILLALTVRLAMVGTLPYLALSGMMFLALLACVVFVKKLNSVVHSEMILRHESAELADQLKIKTEEAEESVYAKSRVLAAASHDLRQPLHALSLFFDALKEPQPAAEQSRIFKRIDVSIEALRKLFDALFDMSRLDANVVHPELSHFDIRQCLEDLQEEYRKEAEKRQLRLRVRAVSCPIESDRALLQRILRNLISNSLRYTQHGGVLISARKRQSSVLIQVWDTGIGIPKESREKAFMEFQQLQSGTTGNDKGLGFGLAIVRRLCDLLGYPLTLRSAVGRGSVMSLEVPIGDKESVGHTVSENQHALLKNPGQRVMVIDDDPSILNAMHTLLTAWGFKVDTATSYSEAMALKQHDAPAPHLILSDLSLQNQENGIEVIRQFRNRYQREIPGILISGTTDPKQLREARASGLHMIQKPISPPLLRSIIQHQLSLASTD